MCSGIKPSGRSNSCRRIRLVSSDFENEFQKSIIEKPLTPEGTGAGMLLCKCYSSRLPDDMLLCLLAGGQISSSGPIHYHLHGLRCHMLIYTINGSAKYTCGHSIKQLERDTVYFTAADSEFSIEQTSPVWDFYIGYISGRTAASYCDILEQGGSGLVRIPPLSSVQSFADQLSCLPEVSDIRESLYINRLLTGLLSEICVIASGTSADDPDIPIYIRQMRSEMDEHCSSDFTLAGFEKKYGKSRYRLCHEFTKYCGMPPIRYLINVRMRTARHLLTTTEMSVREIGSAVGIDDTNHFISLFRRINGMTPLVYRRQSADSPE
jgi:AraC-like DNA-binding protein